MDLTFSSIWQVNEAKSRFSELLDRAQREGPQIITRHGKPVARVVPIAHQESAPEPLAGQSDGFFEFLLSMPKVDGFELPPRRSRKSPVVFDGDVVLE